jgi:hypothetical protein
MKRNNRVVIALQGLCLTLVLVIQCTLTQVTIPTIELSEALDVHHLVYKAEAFTVLSLMLGLLIIVLEFCKEYKS